MSVDPSTAPYRPAYVRGADGLYYKVGIGGVVSVNGETGAVVLDATDVGATTKTYVDARTPKITVSPTDPKLIYTPAVGDLWVNSA